MIFSCWGLASRSSDLISEQIREQLNHFSSFSPLNGPEHKAETLQKSCFLALWQILGDFSTRAVSSVLPSSGFVFQHPGSSTFQL